MPSSYPGDLRRSQSLNGFSYVEGNPVNRVDPSGLIGCIGGGNAAVMEFDNCVTGGHGGISSGQPVGGGVVPVAIVVGLAAWIYHQLPGFDLLPPQGGYDYTTPGVIQPCFSLPGTNIRPYPFWLPGYGPGNSPYYGTGMIGTPLLPPGYLPTIHYSDPRPSSQIRKSIRSLEQQIAGHQQKIDQRIGFDPVSNDPVINQRAAEARLRHLQHEIEVFRNQIAELTQELINRGETP